MVYNMGPISQSDYYSKKSVALDYEPMIDVGDLAKLLSPQIFIGNIIKAPQNNQIFEEGDFRF
jgi:hypothetical protein